MLEKVSQIHETYLLDQQLFCWRHFSKTEVMQNTDLNILTLYSLPQFFRPSYAPDMWLQALRKLSEHSRDKPKWWA